MDCVIPICTIILSVLSLSRQCCVGTSATRSMGCFSPACTDTVCRSGARSSRLLCLCWRDSSSFWKTNCRPASPPTPAAKPSQVPNHHRGATVLSTGFELCLRSKVCFDMNSHLFRPWPEAVAHIFTSSECQKTSVLGEIINSRSLDYTSLTCNTLSYRTGCPPFFD